MLQMENARLNKGFTLIEVMISMVILSFVLLGLLAGIVAEKRNVLKTALRDEAVLISRKTLNFYRSQRFASLTSVCSGGCDPESTDATCIVRRRVRNNIVKFGKSIAISQGPNPDIRLISVTICWKLNGKTYNYNTTTILRQQ